MGANQFLPFGTGGGANVIDQVTYSGLAARAAGFSAGTAESAQLNKVWRQSSIVAAMIGQLIADYSGSDANDDGDIPTLETQMITAVRTALRSWIAGVVGQTRNLVMNVATAAANVNITADEVIVESALGGERRCLNGVNGNINLGTVGAGGMDVGTAPVNGYVAIYLIFNPTNLQSRFLARDVTSITATEIYGGANMPSGYVHSALVSVRPTNGSGQFKPGYQIDRDVYLPIALVLQSAGQKASPTSLSVSAVIPRNAKSMRGTLGATCPTPQAIYTTLAGDTNNTGQAVSSASSATAISATFDRVPVIAPQTLYCTATTGADTPTISVYCTGYTF